MLTMTPRLAGAAIGNFTIREHDACGVSFLGYEGVRDPSYEIIQYALDLQYQMRHRAGINANGLSDGIGLMTDLPQQRFQAYAEGELGKKVINPQLLAVASVMLPQNDQTIVELAQKLIEEHAAQNGQSLLGWRRVPTNYEVLGVAEKTAPAFWQLITESNDPDIKHSEQEARVQQLAHRINGAAWREGLNDSSHPHQVYMANFSTQRLLYKGMTPHGSFDAFFEDVQPGSTMQLVALIAAIHVRYSTNTGSIDPLAQGFSSVMHNGEINTIVSNARRMMERAGPDYLIPGLSDSAILDMAYSYLVYHEQMPPDVAVMALVQPLSRFHAPEEKLMAARQLRTLMGGGGYNGPANLIIQAPRGEISDEAYFITDNNGMRPSNLLHFNNGLRIYGSEVITPKGLTAEEIVKRQVMGKGYMAKFDVKKATLVDASATFDNAMEQVARLSNVEPQKFYSFPPIASNEDAKVTNGDLIAMSYHQEYITNILAPMGLNGKEPIDAMGRPSPIAVLRKTFANPYEWAIHQHVQVSAPTLASDIETADFTNYVTLPDDINLPSAMLRNGQATALKASTQTNQHVIDATYDLGDGVGEANFLENLIDRLAEQAVKAAEGGKKHIWISHANAGPGRVAIPSMFLIGAVNQALLEKGIRSKVGIYAEAADVGEPHSFSMAVAAGADAVNPFMALDWLKREADAGRITRMVPKRVDGVIQKDNHGKIIEEAMMVSWQEVENNYQKALDGPVSAFMKIRSKMGAPDIASYTGSNFFALIGVDNRIAQKYFPGIESRIDGVDLNYFDQQARNLREIADKAPNQNLPQFGIYRDHSKGTERDTIAEPHYPPNGWPQAVQDAIHLGHENDDNGYQAYKHIMEDRGDWPVNLRDLLEVNSGREPISIDEVMSEDEIIKTLFQFGHASFGSLSHRFKSDLAKAAEILGITSGSGEGGIPNVEGHVTDEDIQIASARFGIDVYALAKAGRITIKISQGAKPGIGGELPGIKVEGLVAETRNVVDGTTLISPPNHFGLHSIEDLGLLIRVLKKVSNNAEIAVKVTSGVGVEAVAAGIAKGGADVHTSGFNGGTGASPISATHHSGYPWEMTTATTLAHMRRLGLDKMADLIVDGSIYSPDDAFDALLSGASKIGLMTLPMIFAGCDKQDDCHSGNCDRGIATNKPDVMAKYKGTPEDIVRGTRYFARLLRERLANAGFRNPEEARGQTECLKQKVTGDAVLDSLKLKNVLPEMPARPDYAEHLNKGEFVTAPNVPTANENRVMEEFMRAYADGAQHICIEELMLDNDDIGFLTQLSGEMARLEAKYPNRKMPIVEVHSEGIAGEYAGFALHPAIHWHHKGFMNDGAAEVNSGGLMMVTPYENLMEGSALLGNSGSYGQTKGVVFVGGEAGTRTAPRFSGGVWAGEGVGDNSFEFTTGGLGIVMGDVGHNFAAGSHGGVLAVINANPEKTIANTDQRTLKIFGPDGKEFNKDPVTAASIDPDNLELLSELIKAGIRGHAGLTNRASSRKILENWDSIIAENNLQKLMLMIPNQAQDPQRLRKQLVSVTANLNRHGMLQPTG